MSPSASGETAVEESKSNGSVSGFSRLVCNHNKELMDPFVSSGEDDNEEGGEHSEDKGDYAEEEIPHIGEVTGANAMLTDMPDEDSTLDHAIMSDIIRQYADYEETTCNLPSSPGHTFPRQETLVGFVMCPVGGGRAV